MARQLFDRLNVVFTDAPEQRAVAQRAQWPNWNAAPGLHFGDRIPDVRSVVVHETTGWPTRLRGDNMFDRNFFGGAAHAAHSGETSQMYVSGDGTVMLGITLPLITGHATFVNSWAIGIETGHGWGNYSGNDHIGPLSQSDHTKDANGDPVIPPYGQFRQLHNMPVNRWIALSAVVDPADPNFDDFPGIKLWIDVRDGEIVVGQWTTPRYTGPWRQTQRVAEMLFNEAQYQSWALLARYLAERYNVPRNFPLLPHKMRSSGFGTAGGLHGTVTDAATFRKVVRTDEALSRSPATFGMTQVQFNDDAVLAQRYANSVTGGGIRNTLWTRMFDKYRGFHGHGFSGDPDRNRDHDCPGPMFDWHRFAREVWDWWWHPFDFNDAQTATNVPRRPYSHDWDGDTQLKEFYFNTAANVHPRRAVPGIHGASGSPRTYRLEAGSPVYALATGELVAARFPAETGGVSLAFTLVRHAVYHTPDLMVALPDLIREQLDLPPGFPERISYDSAPSTVYSLYIHLGRPDGMDLNAVATGNPDWLNRLLMRKKECELGLAYLQAHPPTAQEDVSWNSQPPGAGAPLTAAEDSPRVPRPTVRQAWAEDDRLWGSRLDQLRRGEVMIAPGPDFAWATPVRVLLGDFMGNAGVISRTAAGTTTGVRVEVFSHRVISSDFDFVVSDAAHRWNPPQLAGRLGGPALLYSSEWWDFPEGAEKTALEAIGVDVSQLGWMNLVEGVTIFSQLYPADGRLARGAGEVHYDPDLFMAWINRLTWHSEWPKYRVTDPAGVPLQPLQRAG